MSKLENKVNALGRGLAEQYEINKLQIKHNEEVEIMLSNMAVKLKKIELILTSVNNLSKAKIREILNDNYESNNN